jgi:hypothetical protein
MASFRIHRIKESARQHFRWAPHTSGMTTVKPKDYEPGEALEAETPYALWATLKDTEQALNVGDILEVEGGALSIYKYVGFEEARWAVPETKAAPASGAGAEEPQPPAAVS